MEEEDSKPIPQGQHYPDHNQIKTLQERKEGREGGRGKKENYRSVALINTDAKNPQQNISKPNQ